MISIKNKERLGHLLLLIGLPKFNKKTWQFMTQIPNFCCVTVIRVGYGISRARVTLTDASGEARTALTNSFGYFRFDSVSAGQTYVFNVSHKRYHFAPQVLSVNEAIENVDFVALP